MRESSAYQLILTEGAVTEAKKNVLRLGRKRFGPPDPRTIAALEAIMDLDRLGNMIERLLDATTWEELLATP